jgi:hypothetical protein
LTKKPKIYVREKIASSTNGVEKTGIRMWKTENTFLSFILYINQFQVNQNLNVRHKKLEATKEKCREINHLQVQPYEMTE